MRSRSIDRRSGRSIVWVVVAVAIALLVAGCGSDATSTADSGSKLPTKIGTGEGALSIIAWAGYAENGSNDPKVDWVTPFEQSTGCKTTVKIGNTSDEMVQLMETGDYDGVSASGNASLRLIAAGDVSPVNTKLLTNYPDVAPFLKMRDYNSKGGQMYGMPHGWGANLLMYNADVVKPAPDSWSAVYDSSSAYSGKITAYDDWTVIADAAVYLMSSDPSLGIKDPYALDQKQFDASVNLLKKQKPLVGEYWSDYLKYEQASRQGSLVLGSSWQVIANAVAAGDDSNPAVNVKTVLPKEGATAWSDTWMISSKAKHPNCMYEWMNWVTKPDVNAQVAEWFGEAPANLKACTKTSDPTFCATYHADDAAYAKKLWYWTVPTSTCLDGRTDVKCVPFQKWVEAWTEVKG